MYKFDLNNWKKANTANLRLLLSQAEKHLDETVSNSDKTTRRFYSIFLLMIGIFSSASGLLISKIEKVGFSWNFTYGLDLSFLLILLLILLFYWDNILPRSVQFAGRKPSEGIHKEYMEPLNSWTEEEQVKGYLIDSIQTAEYKIQKNLEQTNERLNQFRELVKLLPWYVGMYFVLRIILAL